MVKIDEKWSKMVNIIKNAKKIKKFQNGQKWPKMPII